MEKQDINILGTYIDRVLSTQTGNRSDCRRMVKDSAKGLLVVTTGWRLDCFARNRCGSTPW